MSFEIGAKFRPPLIWVAVKNFGKKKLAKLSRLIQMYFCVPFLMAGKIFVEREES